MNRPANSTLYYVCWWCCCCLHVRSTALPKLYFVTLQNEIPLEFPSANVQTQNLSNYSHNVWYYRISSVIPCMKCDYYCHATMATIWPATLNEKHSIFMVLLHQGYETDKLNKTLKTNKHTGTKMHWLDSTRVCSSAGNIKLQNLSEWKKIQIIDPEFQQFKCLKKIKPVC